MSVWIEAVGLVVLLISLLLNIYQYLQRLKEKKKGTSESPDHRSEEELSAENEIVEEIELPGENEILTLYESPRGEEAPVEKEVGENRIIPVSEAAEKRYLDALKEKMDHLCVIGSPVVTDGPVRLSTVFVSPCLLEIWRSGAHFDPVDQTGKVSRGESEDSREDESPEKIYFTPAEMMRRAFEAFRLFLITGDPGSGKTTLLKYYTLCCCGDGGYENLGFGGPVLPFYLPLRELKFDEKMSETLPEMLSDWATDHLGYVSPQQFYLWLHRQPTLLLLDGLDEIGRLERRQRACQWIATVCENFPKVRMVVTSRRLGYCGSEGVELTVEYLQAVVMDLSPAQQEEYIKKWFSTLSLPGRGGKRRGGGSGEGEGAGNPVEKAGGEARVMIDFLNGEDRQNLRQMAAVPLLLQIMVVLWRDRPDLPGSRSALFDAALDYLLAHGNGRKKNDPLLPNESARQVLSAVALWMQEELQEDGAPRKKVYHRMQVLLDTLDEQPNAEDFCHNLHHRVGLIAPYGVDDIVFRHKTVHEYLAGVRLANDAHQPLRLEKLLKHFGNDWWEETLRFFIGEANDAVFDKFMHLFFHSAVSRNLDQRKHDLLQTLVTEVPHRKVNGLLICINDSNVNDDQRRYVLDCLRVVGTRDAVAGVRDFIENSRLDEINLGHAEDIVAEIEARDFQPTLADEEAWWELPDLFLRLPNSFRNPVEDNARYVLIPGGRFMFSVTRKVTAVPHLYFGRHPVTNRCYRRFISYLAGRQSQLEETLPLEIFTGKLFEFAETVEGFRSYLGKEVGEIHRRLSSLYNDKPFGGDDQPVVGISWYGASAYCFWLSCLYTAMKSRPDEGLKDVEEIASIYRLPHEVEWEWAASGRETDGLPRPYPWFQEKGGPNESLANFNRNRGTTTPVGRYPQGANPEGLMDMLGNVWEWMGNPHHEEGENDSPGKLRALRGGAWYSGDASLNCFSRGKIRPGARNFGIGFRVIRAGAEQHNEKDRL